MIGLVIELIIEMNLMISGLVKWTLVSFQNLMMSSQRGSYLLKV